VRYLKKGFYGRIFGHHDDEVDADWDERLLELVRNPRFHMSLFHSAIVRFRRVYAFVFATVISWVDGQGVDFPILALPMCE
jgi:uncharacterized membrane protein